MPIIWLDIQNSINTQVATVPKYSVCLFLSWPILRDRRVIQGSVHWGGDGAGPSDSPVTLGVTALLYDWKPTAQTLKPALTFQLYVSDQIIAERRTEGASSREKRKEKSIIIIFSGYQKRVISPSLCSHAAWPVPAVPNTRLSSSPSAHSCSQRIKTILDPPMSKSLPQGWDFFFYWMLQRKESLSFSAGRRGRGDKRAPASLAWGQTWTPSVLCKMHEEQLCRKMTKNIRPKQF